MEAYKRDLGDKVFFVQTVGRLHSVLFNMLDPGPLQDVRVRKAIALWMDKQEAIPAVLGGFGDLYTLLWGTSPWVDPEFRKWPGFSAENKAQDRAEAKRLMAEAGYANGVEMTTLCRFKWSFKCEWVQAQLAGLSIDLKIEFHDDAIWYERNRTLGYDMQTMVLCGGTIPETCRDGMARYSVQPNSWIKHEDAKIDEFFDEMLNATDLQGREKAYRALDYYVTVEQAYHVPVWGELQTVPFRSHVKGLQWPPERPSNNTDYATVWLEK